MEINSVNKLLDETKKLSNSENWIYRGVNDLEEYKLIPSIGRIRHKTITDVIKKTEEQRALWKFRDKVRPFMGLSIENELEWMVVAQHHGLPTRLLDWTRSPLVAAYFAVKKIEDRITIKKGKTSRTPIIGGIYAVKRPPKVGPLDRKKPYDIDKVKLIDPPHISERIPRQVSVLTIHPTPQKSWKPNGLIQIVIPKKHKLDIKYELDRLGINEASLFPGIDATAEHIKWQLKWNRILENF